MANKIDMEFMFDWLEKTAYDINMDPITRPCILKSSIRNPKYLSGIIIIAQSHISLHYEYSTNTLYMDIFSCMPFDYSVVSEVLNELGLVKANELIARGTKHQKPVHNLEYFLDIAGSPHMRTREMIK